MKAIERNETFETSKNSPYQNWLLFQHNHSIFVIELKHHIKHLNES